MAIRSIIEADGFKIEWDGFAFLFKIDTQPVGIRFMLSPSTVLKLVKELGFTIAYTPEPKALIKRSDIPQPPFPS